MFEIKNGDTLFRLSFIERIEEPEDRRLDLIMCWLEITGCGINLQCQCELTIFDLESLKDGITHFYTALNKTGRPKPVSFAPRVPAFTCGLNIYQGSDYIEFTFSATPDVYEGWKLTGSITIDQSYFPSLMQGIESILTN